MADKHTPGPWEWVNGNTDEPFDFSAQYDGEGYPSLRTVEHFGENKTEIREGGSYTTFCLPKWILDCEEMHGEEATANARLIAAAPELLAQLRKLHSSFCDKFDQGLEMTDHDFALIRANAELLTRFEQ